MVECSFTDLRDRGFESRCSHLNFRYHAFFERRVPWHFKTVFITKKFPELFVNRRALKRERITKFLAYLLMKMSLGKSTSIKISKIIAMLYRARLMSLESKETSKSIWLSINWPVWVNGWVFVYELKWLWVRVPLQPLKFQISRLFRARSTSTFRYLQSVDSLCNAYVTW